jgi:alpha/beta superfamily hydrolase
MKKLLIIGLVVVLLLAIGLFVLPAIYISSPRQFEEQSIEGQGFQLHGYVSEGTGSDGKWVILVHGNRGTGQEHELYQNIRAILPPEYSVFAVDLRGFGGSVGNGENQLPESIDRSADLATVSNFLSENYGIQEDQIVLIGHSFGAAQVISAAQDQDYLLVIPIGLGDWDALLESDSEIDSYIEKFYANTGIRVERSVLIEDAENFTTESFARGCPESPVWFVYASQDDAIPSHWEAYKFLSGACPGLYNWSEIPLSDHMYGTEMSKLPEPLRGIYSRLSLSLLKYRLDRILHSVDS